MTKACAPTVCIVGGGLSGILLCRAFERRRQELLLERAEYGKKNDRPSTYLDNLPILTCFEKAAASDGVWLRKNSIRESFHKQQPQPKMKDDLRSTRLPLNIELYDHPYDEYFGTAAPEYLPHSEMLLSVLAQVTARCADFWLRYFCFGMEVVSVVYNEQLQKFAVQIKNVQTNSTIVRHFDKCIWACGETRAPNISTSLRRSFIDGDFADNIIDNKSNEARWVDKGLREKRMLIVGEQITTEDLALEGLKIGAEQIYISIRCKPPSFFDTTARSTKKDLALWKQNMIEVTEKRKCICFTRVCRDWPQTCTQCEGIERKLRNVKNAIICTEDNPSKLDNPLRDDLPFWDNGQEVFSSDDWIVV